MMAINDAKRALAESAELREMFAAEKKSHDFADQMQNELSKAAQLRAVSRKLRKSVKVTR